MAVEPFLFKAIGSTIDTSNEIYSIESFVLLLDSKSLLEHM